MASTPRSDGARKSLARIFFVVFLLIQVTVPAVQLFRPRPARFGWQMFSAIQRPPEFRVRLRSGASLTVDGYRYVGNARGDLDYERFLPPHLCRVVWGAVAVEYRTPHREAVREYRCR